MNNTAIDQDTDTIELTSQSDTINFHYSIVNFHFKT